jgi:hypothetical protein
MTLRNKQATMSQIMEQFLPLYRQSRLLSPEQASACQSIIQCQTDVLGGYVSHCDQCEHQQCYYQSCGNRHCPKCKQKASIEWEKKQLESHLPVTYYHLVFTLPHQLNAWAQLHPQTIYNILFQAAWKTLQSFSKKHKRLRGQLGVTSVLHTWGQNLNQHIHLHCLIPGITLSDNNTGIETTKSQYLYPVAALKKKFRGIAVSLLRQAWKQGQLSRITQVQEVDQLLNSLMGTPWVIYIKPYIQKSETIVRYLSRYTYKIAISNHRITDIDEHQVSFRWKDYRDGQQKMMQLDGDEFIRRFLLHVLPKGFMRVRHFGFLANSTRKKKLVTIRQLMDEQSEVPTEKTVNKNVVQIEGSEIVKPCLCPTCKKGNMVISYWVLPLKRRRIQNG